MTLKFFLAATLLVTALYVAFAQTDQTPKPTLEDAQKVVQMISNDTAKLQTYCELGRVDSF
jgi:Spy/CpxP family protein refolding chaperone